MAQALCGAGFSLREADKSDGSDQSDRSDKSDVSVDSKIHITESVDVDIEWPRHF